MRVKKLMFVMLMAFLCGSMASAQDYKYIGAAKCKMCHNKPAKGEQYNKWKAAPHSKAMLSLKSEKSLAYAKEHGIADPSKDAKCLKCHSTAGAVDPSLRAGIRIEEGVSCESCHGPGSVYKSMSIMKDREKALQNGLIMPTKEVCEKCHNKENPFYKPFNFEEFYAKIAHPDPTLKK
ncbi:MAG: cytochrome C554 [Chlorobi bacterium]|nr:cytochrome C554 [Chlorobiota bacterium]